MALQLDAPLHVQVPAMPRRLASRLKGALQLDGDLLGHFVFAYALADPSEQAAVCALIHEPDLCASFQDVMALGWAVFESEARPDDAEAYGSGGWRDRQAAWVVGHAQADAGQGTPSSAQQTPASVFSQSDSGMQSEPVEGPSILDTLPPDLVHVIVAHLDLVDVIHLSATCRTLRAVALDDQVWRRLCRRHYPAGMQEALRLAGLDRQEAGSQSDVDRGGSLQPLAASHGGGRDGKALARLEAQAAARRRFSWRGYFIYEYTRLCVECMHETPYVHSILGCRLCDECERTHREYTLLTAYDAMDLFELTWDDLAHLSHVDIYTPEFNNAHLRVRCYLQQHVQDYALAKYGGDLQTARALARENGRGPLQPEEHKKKKKRHRPKSEHVRVQDKAKAKKRETQWAAEKEWLAKHWGSWQLSAIAMAPFFDYTVPDVTPQNKPV